MSDLAHPARCPAKACSHARLLSEGAVNDVTYLLWLDRFLSSEGSYADTHDLVFRRALLVDPRLEIFNSSKASRRLFDDSWRWSVRALGENPMAPLWVETEETWFFDLLFREALVWGPSTLRLVLKTLGEQPRVVKRLLGLLQDSTEFVMEKNMLTTPPKNACK